MHKRRRKDKQYAHIVGAKKCYTMANAERYMVDGGCKLLNKEEPITDVMNYYYFNRFEYAAYYVPKPKESKVSESDQ